MLKKASLLVALALSFGELTSAQRPAPARAGAAGVALGDWPEARGPNRDGISKETGLVEKWALNGENFLWRAPYGGRSAPIVMGNRVYLQNPSGRGAALQERVMALDADTGKVVWEYKFNIFQSDVPPHRVGWASPAADPDTGNIYALGVGATVIALSKDGKLLWERSVGEEFAAFTTHGGRTMSPLIDGDLVIVSAAISSWGAQANRAHRFIALDKRTGDIVWVAIAGRTPVRHRLRGADDRHDQRHAAAHLRPRRRRGPRHQAADRREGLELRRRQARHQHRRRRVRDRRVIVSHGDENLDTSELGMIAAIDGSQTGDIKTTKWAVKGDQFGFSSPVIDGTRVYQIDNGSRLKAFDLETGRELWRQPLGTVQKAPLVMADGKLYVGTESGKFFIVRPHADRAEILSEVELPISMDDNAGQSVGIAGAGVWRRRDLARPRVLRLDRRHLRDRTEGREGDDGHRRRRAGRRRARARRRTCRSARPSWC